MNGMVYVASKCCLQVEILSDDEEGESEVVTVAPEDKYRPQSLEKMITLVAMLVEASRGQDKQLQLSQRDYQAVIGGNKVSHSYMHSHRVT